ncbi:hypothetical protein [Paramaledivibacter caminithermalis]|jgi:hypothetical protein|uniref:Uncharacterized protein n=1 Tax=Paramaledivibacter caminithermalis (strain DSM 15212 / CIP 107654 / DViRD3) TaxID=1121301 RepID=A0A1M6LFL4_PARC5|nr:hypothetical protein [Paramaledivibacter caminithermalis]SHJ69994.1 hypothetical protein SAMN02745912_00772 [Paramaledivibacter caminithermalis DSM 15212]
MRINESRRVEKMIDEYFSPQYISLSNSRELSNIKNIEKNCMFEGNVKKCRRGDSIEY